MVKRTNNNLQNTTQKTRDRATQTSLRTGGGGGGGGGGMGESDTLKIRCFMSVYFNLISQQTWQYSNNDKLSMKFKELKGCFFKKNNCTSPLSKFKYILVGTCAMCIYLCPENNKLLFNYEKKVMIVYSSNINKTNNHFLSQIIEHKKNHYICHWKSKFWRPFH